MRDIWINEQLKDNSCPYCGEAELACLKFYPDDTKIRSTSKKVGLNEDARQPIKEMIEENKVVCANCFLKLDNDLIDFDITSWNHNSSR